MSTFNEEGMEFEETPELEEEAEVEVDPLEGEITAEVSSTLSGMPEASREEKIDAVIESLYSLKAPEMGGMGEGGLSLDELE
jgi:hypothetical protein